MRTCAHCHSLILFGSVRDGDRSFCNQTCQAKASFLKLADALPPEVVADQVRAVFEGPCPKCRGRGPVDIRTSYFVWLLLLLTTWSRKPRLTCRPCGQKAKLMAALGSFFAGWWGFPFGLILTPVQITRNVVGLASGETGRPSAELENHVRIRLAEELSRRQRQVGKGPRVVNV